MSMKAKINNVLYIDEPSEIYNNNIKDRTLNKVSWRSIFLLAVGNKIRAIKKNGTILLYKNTGGYKMFINP